MKPRVHEKLFYIGDNPKEILLIIEVECSVFYIGQITVVEGYETFNIVCYDDAS